jgi:hypothetical protein
MPAAKTPAEAAKLPGSPHDSAPKAARASGVNRSGSSPIGNRRRHSSGARSL